MVEPLSTITPPAPAVEAAVHVSLPICTLESVFVVRVYIDRPLPPVVERADTVILPEPSIVVLQTVKPPAVGVPVPLTCIGLALQAVVAPALFVCRDDADDTV